jgi:hypothetical protein
MLKTVALFGSLAWVLLAADPREIVRKAVEQDERATQMASNFAYQQRQEIRELDHSGKVKSQRTLTWEVAPLEGSPYKRLVARDDRPLSGAEQRIEEEKLRQNEEQRRNETPEQRERRVADWRHRQDRQHQPLRELTDAFNFTLAGEEEWNGRPSYKIEALPKPGYKPKSLFTEFFPKVKIHAWIDKSDLGGARIEIEALDTISFGGFLVRLDKGSQIVIEQTRMDDELWVPQHVSVAALAHVLLLKGLNREMDYRFSDYKKFDVNPRIVLLRSGGQ